MFLSIVWLIFLYGWFASEIVIAIVTRTRSGGGQISDRGTMLLLWVVIAASMTAGIWFSKVRGSNIPGGAPWLKSVSVVVLSAGLALRWSAIFSLGKSFSANVAIREAQTVLKTGLYRWMRHPSYTGLLLCFVAVGLHSRNWISLLIVTVPTATALLYRIHVEEIALRNHFGQEYEDYCRLTKRLVPGVF